MKGDFTRWTFRPQEHYHGVLKQQGRVDLDADWNEQGAIVTHRVETETTDVIGASGAPQGDPGFMIQPNSGGTNLTISAGHAYVDGILCENEQANLLITAQPDLPGFSLLTAAGMYVAYLRVWERHITYLDDREILEVALGGPDTCTRARTIWQVELVAAGATGSGVTCSTDVPAYDTLIAPSSGTLKAQAQPTTATGPCAVPATAGYTSLENQLYRVEIHNSGTGDAVAGSGTATFKWSRDNGSVVASWIAPPGPPAPNTLFVSSSGKDSVLGFAAGQWIELSDDTRELNFQPGTLVQLINVQGQVLTVDPSTVIPSGGSLNLSDYPLNPKVRRWDSAGVTPTTTGAWLNLENGVEVWFTKGTYMTGDYWMIPARTLTGNIDWPVDSGGNAVAEPPTGIQRHYCKLAVVQFDGKAWSLVATCLPTFPPLTDLTENGIHVIDVRLTNPAQELANDSEVALSSTTKEFGINVLLDAAADPVSAQPETCFVTVDVPYPAALLPLWFAEQASVRDAVLGTRIATDITTNLTASAPNPVLVDLTQTLWGFQPLILPGAVSVSSTGTGSKTANQIAWKPLSPSVLVFLTSLLRILPALQPTSRLLTHLTLKGDFIWSLNDPTLYLDGNVFGVTEKSGSATSIGLQLPSGDGKRGGDFEMWFYLVLPVAVTGVTFSPNPVGVTAGTPATATGTLSLVGTQLTAGNTVTLSAQAQDLTGKPITANIATVPASVTLGTDAAPTFQVTGIALPQGITGAQLVVTASYGNQPPVTGTLTINAQVSLTKLALTPPAATGRLIGGESATLTATLSAAAPTGGAVIQLSTNASTVTPPAATVPPSMTVPAGQTSFPITIPTVQRGTNFSLSITGTFGGPPITATIVINAG